MDLSRNFEQQANELATNGKSDRDQVNRLSGLSVSESINVSLVAKLPDSLKRTSNEKTIIIPKPSKKGLTVQSVKTIPVVEPMQSSVDCNITTKDTTIDDTSIVCAYPVQPKAGLVNLVVNGDARETESASARSTNFPQRPHRKRVDSNPLPDQLLLARHKNRTEGTEYGGTGSHGEKRAMGSPSHSHGRQLSSTGETNSKEDLLAEVTESDVAVLKDNNWEIPYQRIEKPKPLRENLAAFSFTLQPTFPSSGNHRNTSSSSKKSGHTNHNPGLVVLNTRPSSPTLSLASTPALTAPAPQQQNSPPGGLESATTAVLTDPFPESSTTTSSSRIKVTIPLPTPLRFNIQNLSYDSSSGSSRLQSGGDPFVRTYPSAVPSMDASDDAHLDASFHQHVLGDDYLMQLRFLNSQKTDGDTPRSLSGKNATPKKSQIPPENASVSYKRQELVVPTMPTSHRPSPQHRGMGAVTRRNLALRSANQLHSSQTSLHTAPIGPSSHIDSFSKQESTSISIKRTTVNDSLNGSRTAATKGGLFGQNDFFELIKASTDVSAMLENSYEEEIPSMISKLSPVGMKEKEKEKKALARIGRPVAEESLSPERVLDPATLAAIEAARKSADAARMPHVMSPASALESFGHLLTEAERVEILHFPRVYFLGLSAELKVRVGGHPEVNNGYDYKDGLYITHFGDHLRYRYELLSTLGKGSFGKVYRCRDHKLGIDVAVKVIKNLPIFNEQAAMELETLKALLPSSPHTPDFVPTNASEGGRTVHAPQSSGDALHHHFMVQLVDNFEFRAHKCFVFPIFGKNLYEYMRDKDFAGLPMSFVKKVARQLLAALAHLKSLNILHCDIKPENILMRDEATAGVVLIDFGSSCRSTETTFTYIQSRFYRSPEVLLGLPYGFGIDLWSVAAILPELRTSYPAFPGETGADQLACIADVLGLPPASMYERCTRKERYFNDVGVLQIAPSPRGMARLPNSRSMDMITNARRKDADFVDFMSQCLRWEPEARLSLEDCMMHPWLGDKTVLTSQFQSSSSPSPSTQFASRVETPIRADSATLQDEEETVRFTVNAPVVSHLSMHQPDPMKGLTEDDMIRKIKTSISKAVQEDELHRQLTQLDR